MTYKRVKQFTEEVKGESFRECGTLLMHAKLDSEFCRFVKALLDFVLSE